MAKRRNDPALDDDDGVDEDENGSDNITIATPTRRRKSDTNANTNTNIVDPAESVNSTPFKQTQRHTAIKYGGVSALGKRKFLQKVDSVRTDLSSGQKKHRSSPRHSPAPLDQEEGAEEPLAEAGQELDQNVEKEVGEEVDEDVEERADKGMDEGAAEKEADEVSEAVGRGMPATTKAGEDHSSEAVEEDHQQQPLDDFKFLVADWLQYDPPTKRVLTAWQSGWISVKQRKYWEGGWNGSSKKKNRGDNYVNSEVHQRGKGKEKEFYVTWKATWEPEGTFLRDEELKPLFKTWLKEERRRLTKS